MRYLSHLFCSCMIVSFGATAHANDPSVAELHSNEGTKHFNVQHYDNAAEEYQAAYVLDPKPEYLYAVAQAQRLAGNCANALPSYRAYLRTDPPADQRAKAEKNLERCALQDRVEAAIQFSDLATPPALPPPPLPAEPVPMPHPAKSYLVGHILVGAGLVLMGGGAYFYREGHSAIEAHNRAASYDEFLAGGAGIDGAQRQHVVGVSALAAGGTLAVGGIVYYVLRARMPVETTVSAQATHSSALVTLSRSF